MAVIEEIHKNKKIREPKCTKNAIVQSAENQIYFTKPLTINLKFILESST